MNHDYSLYSNLLLTLYLFLIGSFAGYGIELLYRRYVSAKRWVNPGFMKGPWIPLYGFGVVLMSWITKFFLNYFNKQGAFLYNPQDLYNMGYVSGPQIRDFIPIITMGLSMTFLELIAGLIFVKGFKVRLWDYTNIKYNFMGIICPFFSIIWFVVSILFYYFLSPFITNLAYSNAQGILEPSLSGGLPKIWIVFLLGVIYGLILLDFFISMDLFKRVTKLAKRFGQIVHYEDLTTDRHLFKKEAMTQFELLIPDSIKASINKRKNRDKTQTLSYKIKSFIYIDPLKKDNNFDENGRPISDEKDE